MVNCSPGFTPSPVKKGSVLLTRMESITAYKNQRGQPKSGTPEQSDILVSANDMCSLAEWPSHARRNRALLQDEAGGQKKKGRGVLKGFKASKKRFANGSAKLNITFSEKLGGTVGMNYRSFKDDVVVIMKRKLPLIGVRTWSDIHPTIHRLIVADMIDRWDLEDTPETEEKVLKIAKERYRGWRSTLSSTYKAYKTDAARLANLPEDLQPEEWEWMIEYFGTDSKFQEHSQMNADNRKKQKTKHIMGSKSYSQVSFEKRNLETGEEPDCIALWELTHTNDGTWSNTDSQKVYDKALEEVKNKQAETEGPLSSEQKNNIFQTACKDTLECKSSQPRGYGYMAKTSTSSEKFRIQIEEQARATAATQERNSQLSQQVNDLEDQLQAERANTQERINLERAEREQLEERLKEERAERERLLQEERTSRLELEKNMMAKFVELSKQMGIQQVPTKRVDKENSNPNLQNILSQTSSPNKTPGSRPTAISSNALIQAATRQSRMFKAMDPKN
ncbi:uncharacterized protein LOC125537302 isoform X2 [Triticum urartu]|uniref:uncharacterized protein LOC125537302 isoform X2 n=1 Tax=Triticum urartu TaxID=4572 RepID=UPI002044447C|nr:uncharacterized protein LOC125537302 isoform X2 [Triticum urartu]